MLLVGLLVPIPFWILHRHWPKFGWNAVFTPTFVAELGIFSAGINSGIFISVFVTILSQWYLRKWVIISGFEYHVCWPYPSDTDQDGLGSTTSCSVPPLTVERKSWSLYTLSPSEALRELRRLCLTGLLWVVNVIHPMISIHYKQTQNPVGNPDYCDHLTKWIIQY